MGRMKIAMFAVLLIAVAITTVSSQTSQVPSSPTITSSRADTMWVYIEWEQTGEVDSYTIDYNYTFIGCEDITENVSISDIENSTRSYNLTELEEHSNYNITLKAINQAGSSSTIVRIPTTDTEPSGTVQNLTVASASPTSFNITWNRTPCRDRNTEFTRYIVKWFAYPDSNDFIAERVLTLLNFNKYHIPRLIPRTTYQLSVRADNNAIDRFIKGPLAIINGTTAAPEGLGFFLDGVVYSNNSAQPTSKLRSGPDALMCLTDFLQCCSSVETGSVGFGSWTLPSGSVVPSSGSAATLSRGPSSVSLIYVGATATAGVYTCEIPDASNMSRVLYFYAHTPGLILSPPVISGLFYNHSELAMFCISTGNLVDSVTWLKDGVEIESSSEYVQTERIVDKLDVTYEHRLSGNSSSSFLGTFTCVVRGNSGTSVERSLSLNGVNINHSPLPLEVGQDESLVCVSETGTAERMEWSVDGRVLVSASSVDRLVLSFTPVNDSLDIHQKDFKCSVFISNQIINQTLPVSVEVPYPAFNVSIISRSGSPVAGSAYYNITCEVRKLYPGLSGSPQIRWIPTNSDNERSANFPPGTIGENVSTAVIYWNPVFTGGSGGYECVGSLQSAILEANLTTHLRLTIKFQIPRPDVSILKSEFTTTDGVNDVILQCMASVDTTFLSFGTLRYQFNWKRNGSLLYQDAVTTSHNEARVSEITLPSHGVFMDNITCSVRALERHGSLQASTTGSDTKEVSVTVAEICLNTTLEIDLVEAEEGANLTCSGYVCPYLLTISPSNSIIITWRNNEGTIVYMGSPDMIVSNKLQSLLMLDSIKVDVNYSCEVMVPYQIQGPTDILTLTREISIIPVTSLFIRFCVGVYKGLTFPTTDMVAIETKLIEVLGNCSSDTSELNLRNATFEFNNSSRSIVFEAQLLGVPGMNSAELRNCMLGLVSPGILVNNKFLEVVCTTECPSSSVCIIETTSAPDLTTTMLEERATIISSTLVTDVIRTTEDAGDVQTSEGAGDVQTSEGAGDVQTSEGGVALHVIVIIIVVVVVAVAILVAVVVIVVVYYKRPKYHPNQKKPLDNVNNEYILDDKVSSECKQNDTIEIINSPEDVSTFTGSQEK